MSVQFALPSAFMTRTTSVSTVRSFAMWLKVTSYGDWTDSVTIGNGGVDDQFWGVECDAAGNMYFQCNGAGTYASSTIQTGSYTGWIYVCGTISGLTNGSTFTIYYKTQAGSWTTPTALTLSGSITQGEISFGGFAGFAGFINGTFRSKHVRLWTSALSSAEFQAEAASLTVVRTSGLYFSNDGDTAANVGTDQSGGGNNFTITGTPTDQADEPLGGGGGSTPRRRSLLGVGRHHDPLVERVPVTDPRWQRIRSAA